MGIDFSPAIANHAPSRERPKDIILQPKSYLKLIYRCADGHISFARELRHCGMKDCGQPAEIISDKDIEWLYKISPNGLAISEKDLHKILDDKNMPQEVKEAVKKVFPELKGRKRFWFR